MIKKVIFTGGGSGGHVIPAITLIKEFQKQIPDIDIYYIGGRTGIERELIAQLDLPYKIITTGKLRRYFSFQNFLDLFKVGWGLLQSLLYMLRFSSKETIVFSTGGFVSVPVAIAAKLTGKKVYIHEQTSRIGLANKIASKFAEKVFISFSESEKFLPHEKVILSGYPVRECCFDPSVGNVIIDGVNLNNINREILFVTGGGNGSTLINGLVEVSIKDITERFFVLHQVGKNEYDKFAKLKNENYLPVKFIASEMIDCLKLASIIVSRSGAGTVSELIALGKKSIFIPLKIAQKNEQFHNAMEAHRLLDSIVIEEDQLASTNFISLLDGFRPSVQTIKQKMRPEEIILNNTIPDRVGRKIAP
ncbi:MAG: UDP-N-acetylglucosamine--N-acetylmuramyl-(pentapeptide) pyrophosphoryl-undecaprenol N-acetylglucosamine transferase [Bacteriovoracaceae bacterium]|nr:UDP-N-acetylglucosamine--N-acetylmuramyl-(pentapeptide) pyrophosphoryl-undecaprenol N-acetylglucosamine transferase [Bacteriovoracaceae bacterium]